MLIGERMSQPIISLQPEMPIIEALTILKEARIRRAPVIQAGRLLGIVSDKDLLNASPGSSEPANLWEMNYLLSKVTVGEIMSRDVLTVTEDTPIEQAALLMADHKIGGLPVTRGDQVVGMITETDLFKVFLEVMGARELGVRVTVRVEEARGQLALLTAAISSAGGNFVAFGTFSSDAADRRILTFKVSELDEAKVRQIVSPLVLEIIDLRTCCAPPELPATS
jgi:acetoin utilization protein AcuB